MKLIQIKPNFHKLEKQHVDIFFSYQTPIAIVNDDHAFVARNEWSPTTGTHINIIKREYANRVVETDHEDLLFKIHLYT